MAKQYDVSAQEYKNILEKAERRAQLRNEFLKLKSDPFRHATGEGGAVFDPSLQRFQAMKVSGVEHFKPSIRTGSHGLLFLVIPMLGYGYLIYSSRKKLEDQYRRGEVAYKDRRFKFV